MDRSPENQPDSPASEEHGPLPTSRVPKTQYDPAFLQGLQANGQVRSVDANWSGNVAQLPPHVSWILHPNGDLERIGFD
jgi:hypothetical protein